MCALPCGRMRESLFLLTSVHPFHYFNTSVIYYSYTVHILIIFLTNTDYYMYFSVPAISSAVFFSFLFSVNFCPFVCYLTGAVVYSL